MQNLLRPAFSMPDLRCAVDSTVWRGEVWYLAIIHHMDKGTTKALAHAYGRTPGRAVGFALEKVAEFFKGGIIPVEVAPPSPVLREQDKKERFKACESCGKVTHLIQVTDHPDWHDGYYCANCNPYNRKDDGDEIL